MSHPCSSGEVVKVLITGEEEAINLGFVQESLGPFDPQSEFSRRKDDSLRYCWS